MTGNADVSFTFPSKQEAIETMDINFNWAPTSFEEWHYRLHESLKRIDNENEQVKLAEAQGTAALLTGGRDISSAERLFDPDVQMTDIGTTPDFVNPEKDRELLMFALPHHQVRKKYKFYVTYRANLQSVLNIASILSWNISNNMGHQAFVLMLHYNLPLAPSYSKYVSKHNIFAIS